MAGEFVKAKIKKLMVANRSEIALRIMHTAKRMGIATLAICSKFDRDSLHARYADEVVELQGESVAETYLDQEQILSIAKDHGVDAVHPGYGFLSENADFADRVVKAGLIFVGSPAKVVASMGDKIQARKLVAAMGVATIPGSPDGIKNTKDLRERAKACGYPLLLKASAGGGGKGMRVIRSGDKLVESYETVREEAGRAFGNPEIYLERYLDNPRHIEVQVFGDTHGNHRHLYERDCSIQRNHQKIVEEAPAPNLSDELRDRLYADAIKICREIGYVGAGTVEFLVTPDEEHFFIEMNTRLQVEHPVTEWITGLDLVEWQLRVARGEVLDLGEVQQRGHAIEVRLCSENPMRGHLPTTGRITHLKSELPAGLRWDCAYETGMEIGSRYDSMMAKLSGWGGDRAEAIERLSQGLRQLKISGIKTNREYLQAILAHRVYVQGKATTHFLADHEEDLRENPVSPDDMAMAVALLHLCAEKGSGEKSKVSERGDVWGELTGFRNV